MRIIDMGKDIYITDASDAREFLRAHGLDDYQLDEFATVLHSENFLDLEYEHECIKTEFRSYETSLDATQGVLNDLVNMCSEWMDKERTQAGQRIARAVYDYIQHSEVI